MLAAYWHKGGFEVFKIKDRDILKIASGDIDTIKPFEGLRYRGRKVLVVARELCLCLRKRFPPTTGENIAGAVRMEIRDLFPFEKAAFTVNIFEQTSNYCIADIWAWDSSLYEKIEKIFPFTHVIPEDLVFQSEEAEIRLFEYNGLQHLTAHDSKGFVGGISLRSVSGSDLELFVRGLGNRAHEIKKIRAYSKEIPSLAGSAIPVVEEPGRQYPWCMQYLHAKDLRKFSSGGEMLRLRDGVLLAQRIVLYFMVVWGASLFVSDVNYDRAIKDVSMRLDALTKGKPVSALKSGDDYSGLVGELTEKRKSRIQPLVMMDVLAQYMPKGASLSRIGFSENSVELTVAAPEPLDVLEAFSKARCIRAVRLKGSPTKDQGDLYNFVMILEAAGCE